MPNNRRIQRRLRKVDRRLAKVGRKRTDVLEGRLFFQPLGTTEWQEVSIFRFRDDGLSERKLESQESVSGRRFRIDVDRDWVDDHEMERGKWAIKRAEDDGLIQVNRESETMQDRDTHSTFVFRVMQPVSNSASDDVSYEVM